MPMTLTTIISGGQTGADQAGLLAAQALGLQTGGWAPHGWRTDAGPAPWLADAQEAATLAEIIVFGQAGCDFAQYVFTHGDRFSGNKGPFPAMGCAGLGSVRRDRVG